MSIDPDPPVDPVPLTPSEAVAAALLDAATGPKRVRSDAGEFEQYPIDDLLKALDYLRSGGAIKSPRRGLWITKIIPPGAT